MIVIFATFSAESNPRWETSLIMVERVEAIVSSFSTGNAEPSPVPVGSGAFIADRRVLMAPRDSRTLSAMPSRAEGPCGTEVSPKWFIST